MTIAARYYEVGFEAKGERMVRKIFPALAILAILALAAMPWATPAGASADLKEGQAFPTLVLPSLDDGKPLSIADFHGRKIALHVFASW